MPALPEFATLVAMRTWLVLSIAVVSLVACESGPIPEAVVAETGLPVNWEGLPDPFHSDSAQNRPQVVEAPADAKLTVPEGFKVEEFLTGDFMRPRFMLLGPNDELVFSDSGARNEPNGAVYVSHEGNTKKLIENLDRPYGLAFHEEWLYVAEPTSVKRYVYDAEAMTAGDGEEITSFEGMGRGHWTRSLLFDKDHTKLYVTVGSGSNIDLGEDPMRAALHRYNPDGTGHEVVATGLRNIIGLEWYPGSDEIWAAVQERDHLGDDLANDFLVNVKEGEFYGWPYAYNGPHADPRHADDDAYAEHYDAELHAEMVAKTLYPDVLLGAHVAVLDMKFYTGTQFPEEYRGGLFMAFHGSWNRAERIGYNVTFIPFKDGRPQSGPQDFLTGWMLGSDMREVWGRPVGLLLLKDGSMLVSDDGGRKIWRVSYGE